MGHRASWAAGVGAVDAHSYATAAIGRLRIGPAGLAEMVATVRIAVLGVRIAIGTAEIAISGQCFAISARFLTPVWAGASVGSWLTPPVGGGTHARPKRGVAPRWVDVEFPRGPIHRGAPYEPGFRPGGVAPGGRRESGRFAGEPYVHTFKRTIYEYEDLSSAGSLVVTKGAPFAEGEAKKTFKQGVLVHGGQNALKYSAFYNSPKHGGHVLMLGWDHAAVLAKRRDGWYLDAILAHGAAEDNADVCVFHVTGGPGSGVKIPATSVDTIPQVMHSCGSHKRGDCEWRHHPLKSRNIKIARLVTFSITSCSFACVWPTTGSHVVVSHVAFSPTIPLFWMLQRYTDVDPKTRLRMLASLNTTVDELDKFTSAILPYAGDYDVDARYLLRGPYKCRDAGLYAPFKTHPYVTLELHPVRGPLFGGALGFNNDPDMPVEMPPFHSTIGNALASFNACANARAILAAAKDLLEGTYGFTNLHVGMINQIIAEELKISVADSRKAFYQSSGAYKSATVDNLMKQLSKPGAPIPDIVNGRERAIFLLAELTKNPKDPKYAVAFRAVMEAWKQEQMAFSFPIDLFHGASAPDVPVKLTDAKATGRRASLADAAPPPKRRLDLLGRSKGGAHEV